MFVFRTVFRPDEGGIPGDVQAPEVQGGAEEQATQVQPEEGQGHAGASLYDEALSAVPDEHRQYVEPHFKEWDRKVSGKLEEAAQFRKDWEPYESLGVRDLEPDQVSALLEVRDILSDREQAVQFARDLLAELGEDAPADAADDDPLSALRAEVDELRSFKASLDVKAAEAAAVAALEAEWTEVAESHGRDFTQAEEQRLLELAERFSKAGSEAPIREAYAVISQIAGDAEAGALKATAAAPQRAEPAGRAATAPPPVDDWDTAKAQLGQRIRTSVT